MASLDGPVPMEPGDAPGVAEVVRSVYAEYGFAWEPEGYCADLADPLRHYPEFWVVRGQGRVVGCVGLSLHARVPGEPGGTVELDGDVRATGTDCELVRLYLLAEVRGRGLGRALAATVVESAKFLGRSCLEIWSDTRLVEAHALYESLGGVRVGQRTCPGDPDESPEWGYVVPLG